MLVRLSDHRVAAALVPPESWMEVDDHNDLAAARFRFEPEKRPELLDRALGGHWSLGVDDFSFMRNEHFPTTAMLAMLREALPSLVSNYGSSQVVLDEKLAWFLRCNPERLLTLHGASQAFRSCGKCSAIGDSRFPRPRLANTHEPFRAPRPT